MDNILRVLVRFIFHNNFIKIDHIKTAFFLQKGILVSGEVYNTSKNGKTLEYTTFQTGYGGNELHYLR